MEYPEKVFALGSLVRLKSGGPQMVVHGHYHLIDAEQHTATNGYRCVWIDTSGHPQDASFLEFVLQSSEE
jgi:uncharacterized protein YodC (DUF2158 family)